MKGFSCLIVAGLLVASPALARGGGGHAGAHSGALGTGSSPSAHAVHGHTTRNGTYIAPHMQTNPNSTTLDNYGTQGNLNPNTGAIGTNRYNQSGSLASVQPSAPAVLPYATGAMPGDGPSLSFQQGRADRAKWESWHATLTSDAWLGARYWTAQRSLQHPGNCVGTPDFQSACLGAQVRLAGPDTRRKTDPQYRLGWNSL